MCDNLKIRQSGITVPASWMNRTKYYLSSEDRRPPLNSAELCQDDSLIVVDDKRSCKALDCCWSLVLTPHIKWGPKPSVISFGRPIRLRRLLDGAGIPPASLQHQEKPPVLISNKLELMPLIKWARRSCSEFAT